MGLLSIAIWLPVLAGAVLLGLGRDEQARSVRWIALVAALAGFLVTLPLVTGFDNNWLCQRVAEQEQPWTWQLLNWRIAAKEFAISGVEHNQRIRDRQFLRRVHHRPRLSEEVT